MIIIHFKILGKDWKLRLLKKKKYAKKNGADSLAVTLSWKRTIDLGPRGRTEETLRHEMWHAWMGECNVYAAEEIPNHDFEEVSADLFAKRGEEMLTLTKELWLEVLKLTESKVIQGAEEITRRRRRK